MENKLINKRLFIEFLLVFIFVPLFAAAPKWLTELEKVYPTNNYIRMIGEGYSIKQAETDALSSISLNFNAKTKVINNAIKDYNSIIEENKTKISKSYSLTQETTITSEAEFLCVQFSEPYYDKKKKVYYVVGYIDRREASEYYDQKIYVLTTTIQTILDSATDETESLYSVLNYQKASKLSKLIQYYIDAAVIINPSESEKYKQNINLIASIEGLVNAQKNKISFSVDCNDKRYSSICTAISSILQESGFVLTKSKPIYSIFVDLHFTEEIYDAGNFVRPDMNITISNSTGESIDSYSQVYPRYSHNTMENAYNLALVRLQQDLEENFLIAYRGD